MVGFSCKKRLALSVVGLLCLYLSEARAQTEVYLKVQSAGFQPVVLAVSEFVSDTQADMPELVRQVIINDLKMSGFFRITDADSVLDEEASALLEGGLEFQGNRISLAARLFELPARRLIFDKKFGSARESMRSLAHQVSDEVVYFLIGECGIGSTQIAFVSSRSGSKEIFLMDYDGYNLQQLTFTGSINLSPCWSSDGERIAFTSYSAGNPDVYMITLKDGKMSRISNQKGLNSAPAWSPDGKKLALTLTKDGNAEIYTMDWKGGNLRRLTYNPGIDSSPSWSPTAREIAFTSDRSGRPQIYIMDAEGGNVRRLIFEGSYNDSPAWSPRGDRIAFVSWVEGGFHVYTIDVNGENLRRLTDGPGSDEDPCWSPDGFWLAFTSNSEGRPEIYVMNWYGSQLQRLTWGGGNYSPSWSPQAKRK